MSTHNMCFLGEIRKILCGYPLLSVAMNYYSDSRQICIVVDHKSFDSFLGLFMVFIVTYLL